MQIELYQRPTGSVAEEILSIISDLTGNWFTKEVAPNARLDLLFHDVICAVEDGRICAFLMFTSHDGAIHITLMGTSPAYRGQGFGSALMQRLESHAAALGFGEIVVFTVPPAAKPAYRPTLEFYLKQGFQVVKEYPDLWESGALELRKVILDGGERAIRVLP